MKFKKVSFFRNIVLLFLVLPLSCTTETDQAEQPTPQETAVAVDPLPSWNEGETKNAIIGYVQEVTDPANENFIAVKDRVATFDNDGTLWSEKPVYFQLYFALDRIRSMAPDHPEWKDEQPYKAVLENDMKTLMEEGEAGLLKIVMSAHAGSTTEEFDSIVTNWMTTSRHPVKDKGYTELIYQPMLELVRYLQENEFKTFIVSGGGIDFMRPWVEETYGIPKDQVVGSSGKVAYDYNNGDPVIRKLAEIEFIDDKDGKPEGIHKFIGRKPVFAAGNSDGDLQMLRWTDSNDLKSFQLYVHHTDSVREWAYDRNSPVGKLSEGWDEARQKGWTLVDMKEDWKVIFPFELN